MMKSVTRFITERLTQGEPDEKRRSPTVAEEVSGFSFTSEPEPRRRIAPKAIARFKERIRELTSRTRGITYPRWSPIRDLLARLARLLRRMPNAFGAESLSNGCAADSVGGVAAVEEGTNAFKELRKRASSKDLAAQTAGSAHGRGESQNRLHCTRLCRMLISHRLVLPAMIVRS